MPIDFVVSLEGDFGSGGSTVNMENTFLTSDGRIVRLPNTFEELTVPDDYTMGAVKNSYRPGLAKFVVAELLDVFSTFVENITNLDFLIDTMKFMFFILCFCIVAIHITMMIFFSKF